MSTYSLTSPTTSRCPVTRLKNWFGHLFSRGMEGATHVQPASGRCPLGFDAPAGSAFIEKASREAAEAPVVTGEAEANALLAEARASIYHWPTEFPGFRCQLRLMEGSRIWRGHLRAVGSRNYELRVESFPHQSWLRFQIEEFLAHREHPSVSRMASPTGVALGDADEVYGRRVDFLGDKMGSWYRIRDRKLTMIGRSYSNQTFVICIDGHLECTPGQFASTDYTAYYRDTASGRIKRVEAYRDNYLRVEGVFLPSERRYTEVNDNGMICRALEFSNHQLL